VTDERAFGEVLQSYRKRKGISQEKLAETSKLDRTFISLLERGLRQPSLSTLFRLAHALDTTASTLVRAVEERMRNSESPIDG
jgi:transcriptional regulator with XRE-family HTH domain